ncbi:MAG: hypothetical protein II567_03170, partial [Candidatus Riflebacteria bacterium]|nr:hypothetical protein [Candidatus Riflebacteria bacterium]
MTSIRQTKNKKGVAIFFVLFVMIILGILVAQFHVRSRQAQSTVHRFQTSEMARQLAAAAQEEAFKYLYEETDNYESKGFEELNDNSILRKIIEGKESSAYAPGFNRTETNGLKLKIPATEEMAEGLLGDRMEISATARIIDFRDCDSDNHTFYGKEGIGTIEIVTTAKAKKEYKNQFPGACTIVRHHDYKVVSLLSKKDRDNYAGSRVLDYALFIRMGQEEFGGNTAVLGFNLNPPDNTQLEINAGNGPNLGKVHFGTDRDHYTYLNISDKTKNFIPDGNKVIPLPSLEAKDTEVDKFFPAFVEGVKKQYNGKTIDKAKNIRVNSVTGHKAIFKYTKLPITDEYINTDDLKETRRMAGIDAITLYKYATDNKFNFYDGIKIVPENRLNEILDSDIRKQFFNYGYFILDISNCVINVTFKVSSFPKDKTVTQDVKCSENQEVVKEYQNKAIVCFNNEYFASKNIEEVKNSKNDYNYEELYKFVMAHDDNQEPSIASRAFTFINNEYSYQLKDLPPIES